MAATSTEERGLGAAPGTVSSRRRSRRLLTRWSAGHWVMLLAGVLAALVNYTYLTSGHRTVELAVASTDLEPGARLAASDLRFVETHLEDPAAHGLMTRSEATDALGSVLARRVAAGEFVARTALVAPGTAGTRTMSIPVDPAHAVGGKLRVGDRVDVVSVEDGHARFVATDLEVVAVADRTAGGALGGLSPYSVTVALEGDEVLAIAAAVRTGAFELIRANGVEAIRADGGGSEGTHTRAGR